MDAMGTTRSPTVLSSRQRRPRRSALAVVSRALMRRIAGSAILRRLLSGGRTSARRMSLGPMSRLHSHMCVST
eukprot:scaffold49132_cov77-Cyclotella_meneghiniana.AAC.1